jgi:hypothetical protein
LERLSLDEVALITAPALRWTPRLAERLDRTPGAPRLTLLNAARSAGLAARTRLALRGLGWTRVAIGDAPAIERMSVLTYPVARRAEALRLARQFGFRVRHQPGTGQNLVLRLGRDAVSAVMQPRPRPS